jgi:hypothetical protein
MASNGAVNDFNTDEQSTLKVIFYIRQRYLQEAY